MDTFLVQPEEKLYRRALRREMGIWRNNPIVHDSKAFLNQQIIPVNYQYEESTYQIKKNQDWVDLIGKDRKFEHALIIGGNEAFLEHYLAEQGVVKKFTNLDIIHTKGENGNRHFADLNFIHLQEETYDLIIAKSILHHIINLEHLLLEVNKALTPNGRLVVSEFVGENKWQWTKKKTDVINQELDIKRLHPNYTFSKNNYNYYNDWPFEAIRSQEIPEILSKIFDETHSNEVQWGMFSYPLWLNFGQFFVKNKLPLDKKLIETLDQLMIEGENLAKKYAGETELCNSLLFGMYSKSNKSLSLKVSKWTSQKKTKELKLNGPLNIQFRSLMNTYSKAWGVKLLRKLLKMFERSRKEKKK